MNNNAPVLVLGATGKTGKRVAEGLRKKNVPVRAGHRSAPIPFDWQDDKTWQPALQGVSQVYLSFQPDLATPGAVDIVQHFCQQAVSGGVKNIVLLSGRGEEEAQQAEKVVQNSGAHWTVLRSSWFMQNFSESFILDGILEGAVYLPPDQITEPFVDADDIADIAVAALTTNAHHNKLYELTGPQLLTFRQAIQEIAKASKREINYQSVPVADYVAYLREAKLPGDLVNLLNYLFSTVLDGRNEKLTHGIEQALGRKPRDFNNYINTTKMTGVWLPE